MNEGNEKKTTIDERRADKTGFNICALILGIISIIVALTSTIVSSSTFDWYVSVPSGIMAIIFGITGRKDGGREIGSAGIILGILGLAVQSIYLLLTSGIIK